MIIRNLTLHNFCQYDDFTLDIRTGTTGICGPNGSGKTNLTDVALFFWLTGVIEKDTKEDYVKWGKTEGWVSGEFEAGNTEYSLTRNLHNSGAVMKWSDPDGTKHTERGVTKIDVLMQDILKAPPDVIRATRFCTQTGLISILEMTDQARLTYFQKVTRAMGAECIRALLQVKIGSLPQYRDQSADIVQLQAELATLEQQLLVDRANLSAIPADQAEDALIKERGVITVRLASSSAETVETKVQAAAARETAVSDKVRTLEGDLGLKQVSVEELQAAIPSSADNAAYSAVCGLRDLNTALDGLRAKLSVLPETPAEPVMPSSERLDECNRIKQQMDPVKVLIDTGHCPTCLRPYTDLPNDKEGFLAQYQELMTMIASETVQLQGARMTYQQAVRSRTSVMTSRDSLAAQIKAAEGKIEPLARQLPAGFDEAGYLERQGNIERLRTAQTAVQTLQRQLNAENASLTAIKREIQTLSTTPIITATEKAEMSRRAAEIEGFLDAMKSIRRRIQDAELTVKLKTEQVTKLIKAQAEAQQTAVLVKELTYARDVLHRDCLPRLVMLHMLGYLNACIGYYLSRFTTAFSCELNEQFQFKVAIGGQLNKAVSRLSTGQKVVLALAVRLSLAELFCRNIPIMVLDEPTAWLDKERKENLVDVLKALRELTESNMCVSI